MLPIRPLHRLSPLLLGLTLANSQAQNVAAPDAGALRQQVEQKRDFAPPPTAQPPKAGSAAPARAPASGPTVVVKAFQFEGHRLLSTEALNASVSGFVGRPLGFEELQTVRDAVVRAYGEAGWLAQVNLPRQDVTSGIVTLKIVEATFAGVRFEGEPPQRVGKQMIEAIFAHHIKTGEAARLDQIDRALLLSDDLPGVTVAGALEAGQRDGETALLLKSSDEPAYYGEVAVDNTGSRSTGSQRISANLNINSPTGQGDLVSLALMHTRGSNYARLALTLPAGYSGLRMGANVSRVTYRVVDGPMKATPIKGQSDSLGLEANYPWLRGRGLNVYVSSALDVKSFQNEYTQVESDYQSQALRLGASGNLFDSLGGGGANSASLQLLNGRLGRMKVHTQIDSLPRAYQKITYSLTRQQALSADHSLLLSLSGQHANEALDSSEKFYIGGPSSVRAYPSSEAGGERGHGLSAEWRWRLDPDWLLTLFVDQAKVQSLPAGSGGGAGSTSLAGYGLSVAWTGPMGINTRLTWARRMGNNPNPNLSGSDSDGTLRRDRFWLSASLPF